MIRYRTDTKSITPKRLEGFFVGWPSKPSAKTHLSLLQKSGRVVLAIDDKTGNVVGFITAVTDGVLSAYIPFLEVLPGYRGKGVGEKLIKKMFVLLKGLYMIDLTCDEGLCAYYEKFGMRKTHGMMRRDYKRQSGN